MPLRYDEVGVPSRARTGQGQLLGGRLVSHPGDILLQGFHLLAQGVCLLVELGVDGRQLLLPLGLQPRYVLGGCGLDRGDALRGLLFLFGGDPVHLLAQLLQRLLTGLLVDGGNYELGEVEASLQEAG